MAVATMAEGGSDLTNVRRHCFCKSSSSRQQVLQVVTGGSIVIGLLGILLAVSFIIYGVGMLRFVVFCLNVLVMFANAIAIVRKFQRSASQVGKDTHVKVRNAFDLVVLS